jgi:hypothetical protein
MIRQHESVQLYSNESIHVRRLEMMFELLIGSDAARRRVQSSLDLSGPAAPKAKRVRSRRNRVRSISAATLRSLAERLEHSPAA